MRLTGFQGRTAIVTGAAGGIGRAVVAALVDAGARVCATDTAKALDHKPLPRTDGVLVRALDIRDRDGLTDLLAETERELGPVTLAVHAAGVLATGAITATDPTAWQQVIDINAGGTFTLLSVAGGAMAAQGGGAIVVIGSNAGGIPRHGMGAYAASKAAAAMLTRCAGLELAAAGVRCNLVAPGSTLTPMQTGMWTDGGGEAAVLAGDPARFRTGIPLGKLATPEDIAAAAMFLLSDQAGHVTMADLYVDGGATMRA